MTQALKEALYRAAISCGHKIDDKKVTLFCDHKKSGNALSQLADRLEAAALSAQAAEPFGYFHELLNHEGVGNGVWLGSKSRDVTERSHIEGETSKEIVTLYLHPPLATRELSDERIEQLWDETYNPRDRDFIQNIFKFAHALMGAKQ